MRSIEWTTIPLSGLLLTLLVFSGCQSSSGTDALVGGGIGALAGQAIGGDTGSTLIGAAVGSGIGYVIGNEKDKKRASAMSQSQPQQTNVPTHDEVGPLGGTRWAVVSLNPKDRVPPYASKIIEFGPNGRVVTTTTKPGGQIETSNETYRVVGNTLIVNAPGYIINARFAVSGSQLTVSAEDFSAVLKRL